MSKAVQKLVCLLCVVAALTLGLGPAALAAAPSESTRIGDVVTFGRYEQNNKGNDGMEPIEWIVLDRTDDALMLISKYGLDSIAYNEDGGPATWEHSSIREWLNDDFYCTAFSEEEQDRIFPSCVKAEKDPDYTTDEGNETFDYIYLLSNPEAKKYFKTNELRRATATKYTKARGAYHNAAGQYTWWLRSPGNTDKRADSVYGGGEIRGLAMDNAKAMARPVMWISRY